MAGTSLNMSAEFREIRTGTSRIISFWISFMFTSDDDQNQRRWNAPVQICPKSCRITLHCSKPRSLCSPFFVTFFQLSPPEDAPIFSRWGKLKSHFAPKLLSCSSFLLGSFGKIQAPTRMIMDDTTSPRRLLSFKGCLLPAQEKDLIWIR